MTSQTTNPPLRLSLAESFIFIELLLTAIHRRSNTDFSLLVADIPKNVPFYEEERTIRLNRSRAYRSL